MKIRTNEQGYVTDYALVGDISDSIEVPDLTEDELNTFIENYGAYKLIDGALVLDNARAETWQEQVVLDTLRRHRQRECFPIINRGELWYSRLSDTQKEELNAWYQAWLDVTVSKETPTKPEWLQTEV